MAAYVWDAHLHIVTQKSFTFRELSLFKLISSLTISNSSYLISRGLLEMQNFTVVACATYSRCWSVLYFFQFRIRKINILKYSNKNVHYVQYLNDITSLFSAAPTSEI